MERATAPRSTDRGREEIPSLRASRLRLTLDLASLALAAGLAVYPILGAGSEGPAELALAGAGLLGVVLALITVAPPVSPLWLALLGFASEYMTHQIAHGLPAASAIGYGAGLLVLCELATWSTTFPAPTVIESTVVLGRALTVAGTASAAAAVSLVALLGSSFTTESALAAALIGVAGAIGILALLLSLARA